MSAEVISIEHIARTIFFIRAEKVMIDYDMGALYGVPTKVSNQAVKRNRNRFPADFVFQLTPGEVRLLRSQFETSGGERAAEGRLVANWSQIVTGSRKHRGSFYPYAFTEQGVVMLSSALKSERAVKVNIAIMRAFVKLRQMLETNRELARKFAEMEKHVGKHDEEIASIIEAIRRLMAPASKPTREIGRRR